MSRTIECPRCNGLGHLSSGRSAWDEAGISVFCEDCDGLCVVEADDDESEAPTVRDTVPCGPPDECIEVAS